MKGQTYSMLRSILSLVAFTLLLWLVACSLPGQSSGGEAPPAEQPPPEEQPTEVPPTATPEPTPVSLDESLRFAEGGLTLHYPQGWVTDQTSNTLVLAANQESLSANTPGDSLVILIDSTSLQEIEETTENGRLSEVFALSSKGPAQAGYEMGETTPITVDGQSGLQADLRANGGAGRLVVLRGPEQIVRILVQVASPSWEAQQPLFEEMVASMEFFSPAPPPTPTPANRALQPIITKNGPPGFLLRIGGNEGPPDSRFVSARGLDVASDGTLYLAESSRGIWVFAPDGSLLRTFGEDVLLSGAYDVDLGPDGDVFVADYAHNALVRFTPEGTLVRSWGGSGEGAGQFGSQSPQHIAVGVDSSVYALDSHVDAESGETRNSIVHFNGEDGTFIERIPLVSGLAPNDLAVDTSGNLYLADASNRKIVQVDAEGNVIAELGDTVATEGITPGAIDIDRNGNLYVATWDAGIINMSPDGTLISSGGLVAEAGTVPQPGQFVLPNGIAAAPGNAVWVSDNSGEYSAVTALRLFATSELQTTGNEITRTRLITQGGYLRQWAIEAEASSSYGEDYGADGATGPPDVEGCQDSPDAWAPATPDTLETLELEYDTPVFATQVNIHQNHQPGFVAKVELLDERGEWNTVYEAEEVELHNVCPYKMEISFEPLLFRVMSVKITVDQRQDANWSEIDAVELIGAP
jgi:streptogramin lyase